MKKIITTSLIVIFSKSFAQKIEKNFYPSGNIRDSLVILDDKQELYLFFDDKLKLYETYISKKLDNNRIETIVTEYFLNGKIKSNYKLMTNDWQSISNIKYSDEQKIFYPGGNLKYLTTFNDNGNPKSTSLYYENGQLWDKKVYDENYELISWVGFDEDGNKLLIYNYENGHILNSKDYYSNGKVSIEKVYINDINAEHIKSYTKEGFLDSESYFSLSSLKDIGISKSYYPNTNQLFSIEEYDKNGFKTGIWKSYYEDGAIRKIDDFTKDKEIYIRQYFYENGKVEREGKVKNSEFDKSIYFDKEFGMWKFYDISGKLIEEVDIESRK